MKASYQLYSSRNGESWANTLNMLAAAGYTQVEGFGGVYEHPEAFRILLDESGLSMPSGHFFPISNFDEDLENTITTAKVLGMERVFCPAPEEEYRTGTDGAGWLALAMRLEAAANSMKEAGLRFGWHNHHWEFMPLQDGTIPMQIILDNAPSIEWEADIAWIVRGGADPFEWIEKEGARMTTAHVKDIAPKGECEDEDGWADVGHGTMDWAALMSALRGKGVDLFVMEHDNPSDPKRFAERSIAAFKEL